MWWRKAPQWRQWYDHGTHTKFREMLYVCWILQYKCSHHKTNMAARPFAPAKLSKTPTRVNPLAWGVCGICSSCVADELEYIYRRNYSEFMKNGLLILHMASSLCILILFGTYTPCDPADFYVKTITYIAIGKECTSTIFPAEFSLSLLSLWV